jgi:hypothetical protein
MPLTPDHSNATRPSDKHVLVNSGTARLQFGKGSYNLHLNGGTTIRVNFVPVAP